MLALADALRARGEVVRVVALREYAELVRAAGFEGVPIEADLADVVWHPHPWVRRALLAQPGLMLAQMTARLRRAAPLLVEAVARASAPGDVVVAGLATAQVATALSDRRAVLALFAPVLPSSRPASTVLTPGVPGPATTLTSTWGWMLSTAMSSRAGRLAGHRFGGRPPGRHEGPGVAGRSAISGVLDEIGGGLAMPAAAVAAGRLPILLAVDPALTPPAPDWPSGVRQTGFWTSPTPSPTHVVGERSRPPVSTACRNPHGDPGGTPRVDRPLVGDGSPAQTPCGEPPSAAMDGRVATDEWSADEPGFMAGRSREARESGPAADERPIGGAVVGHDPFPGTDRLAAFLAAGPAPVYVGFGSCPAADPATDQRMFVDAARRAGVRVVLQPPPGAAPPDADDVLVLGEYPHAWLFPRMAAVVHHGGAGTTSAAIRAGVPSAVVPHLGDQAYWGRRVADLGLGPRPVPRALLTTTRLTRLLRDVTGPGAPAMRRAARALGPRLRSDGADHAADLILGLAASGPERPHLTGAAPLTHAPLTHMGRVDTSA